MESKYTPTEPTPTNETTAPASPCPAPLIEAEKRRLDREARDTRLLYARMSRGQRSRFSRD